MLHFSMTRRIGIEAFQKRLLFRVVLNLSISNALSLLLIKLMAQKCVSSFIEVWYREQREFNFCIFLYDKRENLKKVAEKLEEG